MDSLEWLVRTFPPPGEVPPADWGAVEAELGLRLPARYKRLCDLYGDNPIGEWGEHVELIAPQAANREENRFPKAALAENASLRGQRDSQEPDETPIPDYRGWRFHPEQGGLLPWAWDGSQAVFFLVDPAADPDAWPIVASGTSTSNLRVAEATDAASFLAGMLQAALDEAELPSTPSGRFEESWARIEAVLESDYPEALEALRAGASEAEIAEAEAELGVRLPEPFRQSMRRHDGQDPHVPWLVGGGLLCSLDDLLHEWREWTGMQDAGDLDEFAGDARPDPGVRDDRWWRRGWLPFVSQDGDHLVIDLDPAAGGQRGQVFAFSHETGAGRLAAPDFLTWLEIWADDLGAGAIAPLPSPYADEDEENEDDEDDFDDDEEQPSTRTWPA